MLLFFWLLRVRVQITSSHDRVAVHVNRTLEPLMRLA